VFLACGRDDAHQVKTSQKWRQRTVQLSYGINHRSPLRAVAQLNDLVKVGCGHFDSFALDFMSLLSSKAFFSLSSLLTFLRDTKSIL